jgi:hypothetical protein
MSDTPNILIWDLETGYNVATIFSLFNKRPIPPDAIQQERYIICGAYKLLGQGSTRAISLLGDLDRFREDPTDDSYVVRELHKVLSEADALVAHYGDNFDSRYFNTRAVFHGLDPLPDIPQIDTYKIAKGKFLFNSNRLDYLGKFLGLGGKISTNQELWARCYRGEQKAVREMVAYNKQDVDLLEAVYQKLAPYAHQAQRKVNMNLWFGDNNVCPTCGSDNLHRRGYRYTRVSEFARFQCQACGSWSSAPINTEGKLGKIR